jgi:hypothetical protein
MKSILKDILGIIVLKLNVKDVLNLQATCKRLNICILQFNKYWFFQYFIKNKFKMLLDKRLLQHVYGIQTKMANEENFIFPYIQCLTKKAYDEIDIEFVKHSNYEIWKIEANTLGFYDENDYEASYCRLKYLKETENSFVCPHDTHYDLTSYRDITMTSINIIDDKILSCYDPNKKYFHSFLKWGCSQNMIKRFGKQIAYDDSVTFLDNLQHSISQHILHTKKNVHEEIEGLMREIERREKYLKDKEEKSKKNMEEFLQVKAEMIRIFK